MAIKNLYPSTHPTLDLNFAGNRTVDPRITFSRASTATYFDVFGVMRTALANAPRIDFDPATGDCKGILMEEQRTNLLTYSEQFDNAVWITTTTSTKVTPNAVVAPNGLLVGTKISENDTSSNVKFVGNFSGVSIADNTIVTATIYAKAAERSQIRLSLKMKDGTYVGNALFSLSTGEVLSTASGYSGLITAVGNGWFKCSVTGSIGAGTSTHGLYAYIANNGTSSYAGDGYSGIYIWGAQLEAGAFPTSYIKTEASQATRAADSAAMTGSNFSSWYRLDEGTIYCEAEYFGPNNADATTTGIVTLGDGTSSNFLSLVVRTDNKSSRASFVNELIANTSGNSYIENTVAKFAIGYKNLDCVFSKDGVVLTGNNSINTIPFNQLIIGAYYMTSSRRLNGRIKRISFYPKRVSNTNDQALTT